jgi:hypothetical protein
MIVKSRGASKKRGFDDDASRLLTFKTMEWGNAETAGSKRAAVMFPIGRFFCISCKKFMLTSRVRRVGPEASGKGGIIFVVVILSCYDFITMMIEYMNIIYSDCRIINESLAILPTASWT